MFLGICFIWILIVAFRGTFIVTRMSYCRIGPTKRDTYSTLLWTRLCEWHYQPKTLGEWHVSTIKDTLNYAFLVTNVNHVPWFIDCHHRKCDHSDFQNVEACQLTTTCGFEEKQYM